MKHSHPDLELTSHSPTPREVASDFTMNYTLTSIVRVWVQTKWQKPGTKFLLILDDLRRPVASTGWMPNSLQRGVCKWIAEKP